MNHTKYRQAAARGTNDTAVSTSLTDTASDNELAGKMKDAFPRWLTQYSIVIRFKRSDCIRGLRELQVFPLMIADQCRTYTLRARIINTFGLHIYCALVYLHEIPK